MRLVGDIKPSVLLPLLAAGARSLLERGGGAGRGSGEGEPDRGEEEPDRRVEEPPDRRMGRWGGHGGLGGSVRRCPAAQMEKVFERQ